MSSLVKRFNGTYREKEFGILYRELNFIDEILPKIRSDKILTHFFQCRISSLKKRMRFFNACKYIGSDISKLIIEERDPIIDFYSDLNSFKNEGESFFIFRNIKLPVAYNDYHIDTYVNIFKDTVIYHLLEGIATTESIYAAYKNEGPYEPNGEVCLSSGDVVLDCGSCLGDFSAIAGSKGCTVYAFEPSQYIINTYLSKTLEINSNFTICDYATCDSAGTTTFTVDTRLFGSNGIDYKVDDVKRESEILEETVKMITLDDFVHENNIDKVNFIKADIEGAERNMLIGAKNILKKHAPKLSICTYHKPDDPEVIKSIILDAQPNYIVQQAEKKLYAYVPKGH